MIPPGLSPLIVLTANRPLCIYVHAYAGLDIFVTSQNPCKVEAVREAFGEVFPSSTKLHVTGMYSDSGVAEQPSSQFDGIQGAINRIASLPSDLTSAKSGNVIVSIESFVQRDIFMTPNPDPSR